MGSVITSVTPPVLIRATLHPAMHDRKPPNACSRLAGSEKRQHDELSPESSTGPRAGPRDAYGGLQRQHGRLRLATTRTRLGRQPERLRAHRSGNSVRQEHEDEVFQLRIVIFRARRS